MSLLWLLIVWIALIVLAGIIYPDGEDDGLDLLFFCALGGTFLLVLIVVSALT